MSKALLLIHGFLTGADDWDVLMPYVKPLYDRVEVFRQPGHERAGDKPHYKDFTSPAVYAAMDVTLDKLADYDRVDVLGHSMGGGVAAYACAKLKNVGRAIMYSPAFKYPRADILLKQNAVAKKLGAMAKSCPDEALAAALEKRADCVRDTFDAAMQIFFRRLLPHWSLHNTMTFMRVMAEARKYLPAVTCPLCVVWGDLDELIPLSAVKQVTEESGTKEIYFLRYPDDDHALIYLGNVPRLARDTLCFLGGGDLLETESDKGEARACYRIVKGDAGSRFVTVTADVRGVSGSGRDVKEYRRTNTATYTDGGAEFFRRIAEADAATTV